MPKLSIPVPHQLDAEDVKNRLMGLMDKIKERHGDKFSNLKEEWGENSGTFSFSTYGFNVKGTVTSEPGKVVLDAELPFAAMMFKGKIEQEVRETLTRVLGSEKRPEA
ncbi:MAG: polyhydroxyalkanoic acid system family protein [Pirellulales bacterium]